MITTIVSRPVGTILLTIAIVVAGLFGYRMLPVSALPQVDFPTIQINASLPGANPSTMASAVATPIERQLSTIAGIDQITSSSSTGSTSITVQFALDRNIDAAALDVQTALSAVTRRLPEEMRDPPSFQKVNPADQPVLILSVRDPGRTPAELQQVLDTTIVPRISTLPGVAQVDLFGAKKYAVRVQFDPAKLAARGLTPQDVSTAISTANSNTAVGTLNEGERQYILDATGSLRTAQEFAEIVIASQNGIPVRVGDVASVIDSVENLRGMAKFNGEPSLNIAIIRQPGANVVQLVDAVMAKLPEIRDTLPRTASIVTMVDRSQSVRHSVADAQYTLIGTALLVVLVIYLVLGNARATFIPALVLPVAAIGTFAGMYLSGFSLDNLSLLALTLATGFVVDDAIVVLENIVRHIEMGKKPREAAIIATKEIAFTVVSISVSLVAVFIPLLFMGGVVGRLFFEFAVVMTIAIGVSAVLALTLIPMVAARVLKGGHETPGRIGRASTAAFGRLTNFYVRLLDSTLRHRTAMGLFTIVSIAVAIWGFTVVPKGFFPTEDTGTLGVGIEVPADTGYIVLQAKTDALAKIVMADPAVARVSAFTGRGSGGRMFVALKDRSERDSAEVVQARLRKKLGQVAGASAFPNIPQNLTLGGRGSSSNFQYTLASVDQAALYDFAPQFEARLRATPGFEDVSSDYQLGSRQARVVIDRDAAARLGVPVQSIRSTLYSAFGNSQVSTIYTDTDSYQVILEVRPDLQLTPDSIGGLYVRGRDNATVPLSAVTRTVIEGAPLSISHQSQLPSVTISFNPAKGLALSQAQKLIEEAQADMGMPASLNGSFQGNAQAFEASTSSMPILFLAAIVVIYIVLGVLYESFKHPITILSGLPAAGIGAVAALWLLNMPLDVIGIIGVVMLIGIVKKNAIMMIDFALTAQRDGMTPEAAIREACVARFRPIMMTTFAALAAALPLALGIGAGAELRQPLGVAVMGGLLVSQILTLFITPVVYLGIENFGKRKRGAPAEPELAFQPEPFRQAAE
ncbi:efflux RND transporter permease subunit [Glacieibacterium frigidum]|uniref:Efflux RND transporter permease subunit n=1 Tax=Glacieibacterium frigidum TaxID=2593303 RepID=A0A552UHL0_9SPHN|nr:efflux RND transporter permease subunit [Glacieibacterium frigidum]TRW17713.1 efflux RND transporter permease subunit [Glacieibacterium frigidum]